MKHKGFSFIEVLQPAVPYHEWKEYRDNVKLLEEKPKTKQQALEIARKSNRFTLGVFYQEDKKPYHEALYGDLNPVLNSLSRMERVNKIRKILEP